MLENFWKETNAKLNTFKSLVNEKIHNNNNNSFEIKSQPIDFDFNSNQSEIDINTSLDYCQKGKKLKKIQFQKRNDLIKSKYKKYQLLRSGRSKEIKILNTTLTPHPEGRSNAKKFKCDQCNYKCKSLEDLKIHKRVHTKEKPYECDQCEYKFTQSGALTSHKRTHTKEKPFKCDQCEYKCKQSGNLIVHKRIHSKEKPFKCDQCEKKFTQSCSLKVQCLLLIGGRCIF